MAQNFWIDPTAGSNGSGSQVSPFNSLANCLSAILTPFESATEDYIVNCLAGNDASSSGGPALLTVGTTSSTARTLRFIASGSDKHTGVRGTGYRYLEQVRFNNDNTNVTIELDGLIVASIGEDRTAAVLGIVRNCLIVDSAGNGVYCGGGTLRLINTAVIGAAFENIVAENNNGTATVELINVTSVDSGAGDAGVLARFGGACTAINTYSGGNATTLDFFGLSSLTSCYSEDGSQSTSTAAYTTSTFTNVTAGSENLKLAAGSALIGAGVGPGSNGSVPSSDFEGTTRAGATTDVGFDQRTGAAAAVLSSPTPSGTIGTQTTATIGATTDQASGNFYVVVDSSANLVGVTASQIKAGQKASGAAALAAGDVVVSTTTPSVGVSGLVASTSYAYAAIQNNANGDSNIVTGTFTTAAATPASGTSGRGRNRVALMMMT